MTRFSLLQQDGTADWKKLPGCFSGIFFDAGVSRQACVPIWGRALKSLRPLQQYRTKGFMERGPIMPRDASFSDRGCIFFLVGRKRRYRRRNFQKLLFRTQNLDDSEIKTLTWMAHKNCWSFCHLRLERLVHVPLGIMERHLRVSLKPLIIMMMMIFPNSLARLGKMLLRKFSWMPCSSRHNSFFCTIYSTLFFTTFNLFILHAQKVS